LSRIHGVAACPGYLTRAPPLHVNSKTVPAWHALALLPYMCTRPCLHGMPLRCCLTCVQDHACLACPCAVALHVYKTMPAWHALVRGSILHEFHVLTPTAYHVRSYDEAAHHVLACECMLTAAIACLLQP